MGKAVAYIRRSVSKDPAREISREMQTEAVRALAKRYGHDLADSDLYIDWGISGRSDARPEYNRMIALIEAGGVEAIYSYSLSRLGRSVASLATLIQLCGRQGTAVRLVVDSIDTSTASGRMLASILATVAAFESDVASERARAASAIRQERGEQIGRPAFGSKGGDDRDALLRAYREAGSYSGAARLLNMWEVKPRTAEKWWTSSVSRAMHRLYADETPAYSRKGARARARHALTGLVPCPVPVCIHEGTLLIATTDPKPRKDGIPRGRLVCRFASHRPGHVRSVIAESKVLPYVRAQVDALRIPEFVEAEVAADEAKLRAIETRRQRLLDAVEADVIPLASIKDRMVGLDAEAALIERKAALIEVPRIQWDDWAPDDINDVLARLIDRVELHELTWLPKRIHWQSGIEDWVPPAM